MFLFSSLLCPFLLPFSVPSSRGWVEANWLIVVLWPPFQCSTIPELGIHCCLFRAQLAFYSSYPGSHHQFPLADLIYIMIVSSKMFLTLNGNLRVTQRSEVKEKNSLSPVMNVLSFSVHFSAEACRLREQGAKQAAMTEGLALSPHSHHTSPARGLGTCLFAAVSEALLPLPL